MHTAIVDESIYEDVRSSVCVGSNLREESSVNIEVHQCPCLRLLLLFVALEAFAQLLSTWCLGGILYTNSQVIVFEMSM